MKFKNFDIADVFGLNDIEQAKRYIGKKGYFADTLEMLDRTLTNCSTCLKEKLCCIGNLEKDFGYYCTKTSSKTIIGFRYFLPLDKVRKEYICDFNADSLDDVKYRACKNIVEVMELLDKEEHGSNLVGTIIYIRHKITKTTETAMITNVQRRSNGEYLLIFGNAGYTLNDLFNCIDIRIKGKYQPFGVEVKEND